MKNGLIVFTPAPCDHIDDWAEHRVVGVLADEVRLATTEAEIAHCLWELRARGAGRVRCVWALWDGARGAWAPQCEPRHLCG